MLSAFTGRKKFSAGTVGRATTAARGVGRSLKEGQDIARAEDSARVLAEKASELEVEFRAELAQLETQPDPAREPLESLRIAPKRGSIEVRVVALAWSPDDRADSSAPLKP